MSGVLKLFSPKKWLDKSSSSKSRSKSNSNLKRNKKIMMTPPYVKNTAHITTTSLPTFDIIFPECDDNILKQSKKEDDDKELTPNSNTVIECKKKSNEIPPKVLVPKTKKKNVSFVLRRKYEKLNDSNNTSDDNIEDEYPPINAPRIIIRTVDLGQIKANICSDSSTDTTNTTATNTTMVNPFNPFMYPICDTDICSEEEHDDAYSDNGQTSSMIDLFCVNNSYESSNNTILSTVPSIESRLKQSDF